MNLRLVAYLVSVLVFYLGLSMALPLFVALYYHDGSAGAFFLSIATTCILGGGM